jgi:tetratricopeptide (TPR) repeat protein
MAPHGGGKTVSRFGDPLDWRLAIIVGRSLKWWNQTTMAQEAGIDKCQESDYEQGKAVPSPKTRKRIAQGLGVDVAFLEEWLLPQCRTTRLAFERATGRTSVEADIEPGNPPQFGSEVTSRVIEAVVPFVPGLDHHANAYTPASGDRSWAEALWKRMESLTADDQKLVVDLLRDERAWALAERLCEASTAAAGNRADEALRLAQFASEIAERSPGPKGRRRQLLGYCMAFVANALRVRGDLTGAKKAFAKADELWQQGDSSDLTGLLAGDRRLGLKATLFMNDGCFERALTLIDEALKEARSEAAVGRLLLKRGRALEFAAEYGQALEVLQQAELQIDKQVEPRLICVLLFNRAVCLCHLDRYSTAEHLLDQVRVLVGGKELDQVRFRWLEGRTWLGLGRREDALAALSEVRQYFQTEEIDYDFALVSLELAVLHLEEGRTQLVRELAEEMFWIFERQKVHKEALAALTLFRRAVQLEEARAEWTRRLIKYLYQAQHNPGLRFEA